MPSTFSSLAATIVKCKNSGRCHLGNIVEVIGLVLVVVAAVVAKSRSILVVLVNMVKAES